MSQTESGTAFVDPFAHTNPFVVEGSVFTGLGAGIRGEAPFVSGELDICRCREVNFEAFRDPPIETSNDARAILSLQIATIQTSIGFTYTPDEGFDFINPFTDGFESGLRVPSRFLFKPKVVLGIGGTFGIGFDLGAPDP